MGTTKIRIHGTLELPQVSELCVNGNGSNGVKIKIFNMNYPVQRNYSNVCRTCLIENSTMKSIFSIEQIMEQQISLSEMLMSCASILVVQGDGLPENVCLNCTQQVNTAFLFRKLCEKSDLTLRDCLNTLTTLTPVTNEHSTFNNSTYDDKFSLKLDLDVDNRENLDKIECKSEDTDGDALDDSFHDCSFNESESSEEETFKKARVRKKVKRLQVNGGVKKKRFECKTCKESCGNLINYRQHMAEVHSEAFKCDNCGKEFKSKNILSRHIVSAHTKNAADFGGVKPKSRRNKTDIVKKRNQPRTCDICNKTFRFHSNLERHKLIHTGEKPYLCNVCGKGFAQMSYLKIHSFIHTGEKPYKCHMCERSFAAPGTLMTHVRTHTGERPHVCKICGKDFPQSGYLSAHIRTHTGEKPVECKVCHRRFNQSGRLIIHMRIHSGEKPYQCKDCGRSFAVKGTLKKHIRTHTGERPYICSVCGQAFAQSGTLATHMKVHKPKQ